MGNVWKARLAKLTAAISHPSCWAALLRGVAPAAEHFNVLRRLPVDCVIDVGANRGQFALACRLVLPGVPVVAFEPIPQEAAVFRRVHGSATGIVLVESAVGDELRAGVLHRSARADSSSLLPIGRRQSEIFAGTEEVGTMKVPVSRLEEHSALWRGRHRLLLKIDVQGYELPVLRGAGKALQDCAFVLVECSEIALYEGQALRNEVDGYLRAHGFTVAGRHNEHRVGGELVQADYLYSRTEPSSGASGEVFP